MLSTFLPFYLLPPVTKFRGVFGGRKLFLPGHSGLIFDGRVETAITPRTRRPSATRVANKNTGSQSCTAHSAPPRRPQASWTGCASEARSLECPGTGPGSNAWSASNTACPTHAGARGLGEARWRAGWSPVAWSRWHRSNRAFVHYNYTVTRRVQRHLFVFCVIRMGHLWSTGGRNRGAYSVFSIRFFNCKKKAKSTNILLVRERHAVTFTRERWRRQWR